MLPNSNCSGRKWQSSFHCGGCSEFLFVSFLHFLNFIKTLFIQVVMSRENNEVYIPENSSITRLLLMHIQESSMWRFHVYIILCIDAFSSAVCWYRGCMLLLGSSSTTTTVTSLISHLLSRSCTLHPRTTRYPTSPHTTPLSALPYYSWFVE